MKKHNHNQMRDRAAAALDRTHIIGERGPRTFTARWRLASALDLNGSLQLSDLKWLETVPLTARIRI